MGKIIELNISNNMVSLKEEIYLLKCNFLDASLNFYDTFCEIGH